MDAFYARLLADVHRFGATMAAAQPMESRRIHF